MGTFVFDAYKGWSAERLRQRCRQLVSISMHKDMLICELAHSGSIDALPKELGDEVRRIVAAYSDDEH